MSSKSKNKGKGFEREVCRILSEIYQDNFERVPHSGAFVGGLNAARKSTLTENQIKAFKGDIIPIIRRNYISFKTSYLSFT